MKIENLDSELELKKEQDIESEQSVAVAAQPAAEEPTELPEKRGPRSRTFQKKKGVLETKYYNTPIHFADTETGALIALTGRLREDSGENVFRSERNRFSVAFDRSSQSSLLFEISKDEYAVRASLKSQFGKHAGHSAPVLQQDEKQLSYADVLPGVDLTYTVHGNGVGGAVILKEAGSGQRFAFCLKAENLLVSWLESEKTLQFRTKEAQEPVFQIPAAYMVDADGAYSGLVDFEVVRKSENECELTLLPDTDWLAQNRRAYPVRLEYRLLCAEEASGLEFRRNDLTADGKVEVGGSGVPFRMQLPEQRDGEIMRKTSVLFACASVPVSEDAEYALCLNRVQEAAPAAEEAGVVEEQKTLIGMCRLSTVNSEYAFDVTAEYQAPENSSYELQLCELKDGEPVAAAAPAAVMLNVAGDTVAQFSAVTSTGDSEEDQNAQSVSGSIGSVGSYAVDLVSGKLNMEMKDFAWEGNRMPVSISRSFAGLHAKEYYGSWSNMHNGSFSAMRIGKGWRMNLMQSMVDSGFQKVGDSYKDTFTYTDESGEETVFSEMECESGHSCNCYEDVNGNGYIYNADTGVLTKGGETLTFSAGRLIRIEDSYHNTMQINYSAGRITSVQDGVGRTFTFQYSSGELVAIVAPNGSAVHYSYCNGSLCCVEYPNGQKVQFNYFTTYGLPSSIGTYDAGGLRVRTSFGITSGRITIISTTGDNARSCKSTTIRYVRVGKQTEVVEFERDEALTTSDNDIELHKVYLHEHPDKNYSYYKAGNENKISVNGPTILPYTDPGMNIGNLKCENLLRNHNFKRDNFSVNMSNWSTNLAEQFRQIQYDPAEKMPGFCAAYLISLYDTDRERGMWQYVTLQSGASYVFSCYLKMDMGNSDPNRGVYLMVSNSSGTRKYRSQMITKRGDFMRVALPFTVEPGCGTLYRVGIYIDGNAKAKAIAPQLERGTMLSPYNYLSNYTNSATYASCDTPHSVAQVMVANGSDVKETFTLSGYISGAMSDVDQNTAEARLIARVHYTQTLEERRNNITPTPSEFYVPVFRENGGAASFAMVQFSKDVYRSVDHVEVLVANYNNSKSITVTDLQLVRNSYAEGLSESDFVPAGGAEETDDGGDAFRSSGTTGDEVETITFEEAMDSYGNALTGTTFQNGELGTLYTAYRYDDSNPGDAIGDAGNNKTEETDARGNVTKYEYDPVSSKPTAVIDRCGNRTEYEYDGAGRTEKVTVKSQTGTVQGTVEYEYNAYDDLTKITRGDNQSYTMTYDAYRNLTKVAVGSRMLVENTYRPGTERLKQVKYGNGHTQKLSYDRYGNLIAEYWGTSANNVAKCYIYSYDASNNLVKTLDIKNKKMYNINRVGENVTSVEEYDVTLSGETVTGKTLNGTMHYSFDSDGKQFRKKYVPAEGSEQKYVYEFRDEQNVAVELPTKAVSHTKTDHLGRKVFDELQLGKGTMNRKFSYYAGEITAAHEQNDKRKSDPETTLVKEIVFDNGRTIAYEYDNEERITKVIDSTDGTYEYTYDAQGQLLTEKKNNAAVNTMTYDKYGNILTKNGKSYTYDATWKDLLKQVGTGNNSTIEYDAQGNPTKYFGNTLTWEKGRQLKTYGSNTYAYNNDGIRIRKQTGTEIHEYVLDGTNIVKEVVTDAACCPKYTNEYLYDIDGTVCGLKYNGTAYYFYKNLQGDVIAIADDTGAVKATYTYDAWGVCTVVSDTSGCNIATINPFRYRGYYYDTETDLYYLQSRYYNPEVGRFINADDYVFVQLPNEKNSHNIFAYCENDPVSDSDYLGYFVIRRWMVSAIADFLLGFIPGIGPLFAPVKTIAKAYGKAVLKSKLAGPIGTFVKFVARNASKLLNGLKTGLGKLWGVGRWLASKIPVDKLTSILAGFTSSILINSFLNLIIPNIDIILSAGGMIAGALDYIFDKSINNSIWVI